MYHQQYLHLQAKPTNKELAFKDHFHHLKKGKWQNRDAHSVNTQGSINEAEAAPTPYKGPNIQKNAEMLMGGQIMPEGKEGMRRICPF